MISLFKRVALCGTLIVALPVRPSTASAQARTTVDSLVAHAIAINPGIRIAAAQAAAARSRIGPAGAWADPMLMAGIQNLPLSRAAGHGASGPDPMTMKMAGVSQTLPYPGKTSLRSRIARAEADAAEARVASVGREIRREVLEAYFDLVAARMLGAIVERQQQVAAGILPATEARYVSGTAAQADVLKARTEAAMLVEERNGATARERSALARLNAALDQPSQTVVSADSFPTHLSLGIEAASLDSLQTLALATHPRLRERRAAIAAQSARAELSAREYLPDFDVTLQYGQRDRLPDMITAFVSVPVPLQRGRKQSAEARAARFDVAAAEAELRAEENAMRSNITRAYAAAERHRANVALLERAILPQARATFSSASATFQSGRGELLGVLDAMRALFATETMYVRTLAEYATALAEIEALVGQEVR